MFKFLKISDTEGTALTNSEAITFAIRLAQHFKTMGLRQDDVVGIIGANTTYLMPLVLACLLNCTPFHAINYQNDEGILMFIFLPISRFFCGIFCYQFMV